MTALVAGKYSEATDATGTTEDYNMARDLPGGDCPSDSY